MIGDTIVRLLELVNEKLVGVEELVGLKTRGLGQRSGRETHRDDNV